MSDDPDGSTEEAPSDDDEAAEAIAEDPETIDKTEQYEDRNVEARESANPDNHRDEEPHNS